MKNARYFFIVIAVHLTIFTHGQHSLNTTNLAHQYNPESEIDLNVQSVTINDTVQVYLKLTINQGKPQLFDYTLKFFSASSYKDKLDAIPKEKIDSTYIGKDGPDYLFNYSLPANATSKMLVIQVLSKFSGFTYYYEFRFDKNPLILKNIHNNIQFNPWIAAGKYSFTPREEVYGYFYGHKFPPALPPMPVREESPELALSIDSTFMVNDSMDITLQQQGLYLLQLDSTSDKGFSFRLENKYYPKLARLEHLTEPLIYITTREENLKLKDINGDKREFDKFWLDLTNSPERARTIIKNYFDRVEQANRLFTTYKEGWKTDRGMIYIIFGPPDEVNKNINGESWTYLASPALPKLNFEFIRTETIFAPTYALIRDKSYANIWYRAIDLWRKGRF
ncbi:hypothetical protein C900_02857 [Fulvivirga imtechensis AK7]|uniref:GWxTD domain-containing protein n=1 Tax=Fulvivirga imtechensis AK7 TaxID=1237149 RepID=L8JVJ4_9BACT|nr:GWxTD domain-containing protein [Fulvivirga imtechensis]ELR71242.1 hypothetical protein C900_02857 [Fulvivirga imtechensis AK7]